MPNIPVGPFKGAMPAIAPKYLPNQFAKTALNCDLNTGALAPSRGLLDRGLTLASNTETIYWFNRESNGGNGYWLQFDREVDVVRGPIIDDDNLRTYFTGDGAPKMTDITTAQSGGGPYPGASYTLGLPAPSAPTASGPSGTAPSGTTAIDVAYTVTYVSQFGEEGPASPPSNAVKRWDGATVALTAISVASGGFVVSAKRIYRTEGQGVYQFVAEIGPSETIFADNIDSAFMGDVLPSGDWIAPHEDMVGLTSIPNGILMGWWGNTIAFSEPYQPHAWPIAYRMTLEYDVVGVAHCAYGLIVVTTGTPYLIAGSSPASMGQQKIDAALAGVSKRSVVDMGEYVIYASADGLVAIGGTEPRVISEGVMTKQQWAAYRPHTMIACRWDGRYLAFWGDSTEGGAFSFRADEGFRFYDIWTEALYSDLETGEIYLKNPQNNRLSTWDNGVIKAYTWRSKEFTVSRSQRPAVAKVTAQSYPVTFEYFADGESVKTLSVTNDFAFRLPTNFQYTTAEFELRGSAVVESVQLATSMVEIL